VVVVRPERPADFDEIAAVVEAAFGKPNEVAIVQAIRDSDGYVPEFAFVAEDAGRVVGHTMLSRVGLEQSERRLLQLAPMAVTPERQRQGIGLALGEAALAAADRQGEPLVLVLGHPSYYPRFGFRPASQLGLYPPNPEIPDETFMAVPLSGYDSGIRGRVVWPPALTE
jgi:putative acetyltransferase